MSLIYLKLKWVPEESLRRSLLLSGARGSAIAMPSSIQRALAIDPVAGKV